MQKLDRSLIRGFDLFAAMNDEDLDAVLAPVEVRRLAKGDVVFAQGDPADSFFLLLHGRLKVVQVTPDGQQVIVRFVGPGEVYGVAVALGRADYPGTVRAAAESLTLSWRSEHWPALVSRQPRLALNTLQHVGARLQEAHTRIREMATEEAERRVAHTVLRLAEQAGRPTRDGILVDFPVSRQDIAEMTGTTLHTVSRILSAWEDRGLVEGGRQRIFVRAPDRLKVLAERSEAAG
ncbi:Crp/Fnr family transcriptional regulator [Propylenella binzhouense]|uniref:Crp/Fnr family transcriptional regulator n=1 Tax=Propylenella binzhouense TaxID=2555902 RepID=A0A964T640_9HYPH|nr:Crp/Fnr family transcriptional regulator [Propylenella binzhouense]MYZ49226.1 Crp/Fnr family transcriptional regulator [Propylenella binzhouense]